MKKVCFLVCLATILVATLSLLVAPVAALEDSGPMCPANETVSQPDGVEAAVLSVDEQPARSSHDQVGHAIFEPATPAPKAKTQHVWRYPTKPRPHYGTAKKPHHIAARPKPRPKPTKPFLTNASKGSAFGNPVTGSAIAIAPNGMVVKILKGVMSAGPGSPWTWAKPGQRLTVNRPIGSLLRFIVAVRNTDSADLPTDGIFVQDKLGSSKLTPKPQNGALFMGTTKIRDLTSEELTTLVSGQKIPVSQYVATIPAGQTLGLLYDVRIGVKGSNPLDKSVPSTANNTGMTSPPPHQPQPATRGKPGFLSQIWQDLLPWLFWAMIVAVVIVVGYVVYRWWANQRLPEDDDEEENLNLADDAQQGANSAAGI